jgi:Ycf66 protein N-terminus
MLAYILAVFIGTGSVGLYLSAFFLPEIHRKQDFIWSGVGCFYALFLWLYAHQVTGGILIGQTASVALIGWLAWQTLKLRRQLAPTSQPAPTPSTTKLHKQSSVNRSSPTAKTPTVNNPATLSVPSPNPATMQPRATPPEIGPADERTAPIAMPLSQIKVPPAHSVAAPVAENPAPDSSKISPVNPSPVVAKATAPVTENLARSIEASLPLNPTPVTEDEQAWIELKIKPSAPAKPLGTPAQPPLLSPAASPPEPAKPAQNKPQIPAAAATDSLPATTKIDSEDLL